MDLFCLCSRTEAFPLMFTTLHTWSDEAMSIFLLDNSRGTAYVMSHHQYNRLVGRRKVKDGYTFVEATTSYKMKGTYRVSPTQGSPSLLVDL